MGLVIVLVVYRQHHFSFYQVFKPILIKIQVKILLEIGFMYTNLSHHIYKNTISRKSGNKLENSLRFFGRLKACLKYCLELLPCYN